MYSCWRLQQSTLTQKEPFKAPTTIHEDKVFNFGKQKHAEKFMKNCEAVYNPVAVNYKHGGTQMAMAIKKM